MNEVNDAEAQRLRAELRGSNAGAMRGQQAEQRGSAQTNVCDGKHLVEGVPRLPEQTFSYT